MQGDIVESAADALLSHVRDVAPALLAAAEHDGEKVRVAGSSRPSLQNGRTDPLYRSFEMREVAVPDLLPARLDARELLELPA